MAGHLGARRWMMPMGVAVLVVLLFPVLSAGSPGTPLAASPTLATSTAGGLCGDLGWQTTHWQVSTDGCQAVFSVNYAQNFSRWNASNQFNYSFSVAWIAEVTPGGNVVRMATPLGPATWDGLVTQQSGVVYLALTQTLNVTAASGVWSPNDTGFEGAPGWNVSNVTLGTATFNVTFQLTNSSTSVPPGGSPNGTYGVKFDLAVLGWPWVSSEDRLGIALESLGASGTHFTYEAASQTLSELWNSDNATFASLVFGGSAGVVYPASPVEASAGVGIQTSLFYAASPDREAIVLLTFEGVSGNYSILSYDPYVEFQLGPATVPTATNSGGPGTNLVEVTLVAAVVVGAALSVAVVGQRRRLRHQGEALIAGVEREISGPGPPPRTP